MRLGVVRERPDGRRSGSGAGSDREQRPERWRQRAARWGERMAEEFLTIRGVQVVDRNRSEEHTSELQSPC